MTKATITIIGKTTQSHILKILNNIQLPGYDIICLDKLEQKKEDHNTGKPVRILAAPVICF